MTRSGRCGSWSSRFASRDLVRGALRLSAPRLVGGRAFWIEGRPSEGGRQVVMCGDLAEDGSGLLRLAEASPDGVNVRSRVHEYGGGEYTVGRDRLFFVDDADGRIHACRFGGSARPISPPGARYADLLLSPDERWLVAVEERPREGSEPENRLIAIALRAYEGPGGLEAVGPPRVVASGHDFYASPVFAPDGGRLAFLAWDHPEMPWLGTFLETRSWSLDGPRDAVMRVAGGRRESLFQPRFSPRGELFVVSDRSGWWNLARVGASELEPVHALAGELGRAQWVFGQSTWDFLEDDAGEHGERRALVSVARDGRDVLGVLDLADGGFEAIDGDFVSVQGVDVERGLAVLLGGSASRASGVHLLRPGRTAPVCLRESAASDVSADAISVAEARPIASVAGRTTHAFFYPPCNPDWRPTAGERPPLLVKSHGGPTARASAAFDPRIQFWTSRGFAVADVDYGGSTGYGRAYRDLLEGAWGVVDVEDCVAVARALAGEGLVDGDRLAISGGSAGGYTTLCALTFHEAFAAGASHYGIGDLEALARDTHKFESRYTDWLVGPLPEAHARYVERSPIHHVDRLACPVIFFQGLEDRVVPPSQAEAMVAALARRGLPHAYVPFAGEQHGFRRAENIRTALEGELYFYGRLFGFEAPRPEAVRVVGVDV
ncbi:MAG TPA: prolyl oligopeptidase family serine peptidase [Myxococcota bacterium]|nr:prolyl oligopeptidase family serine peptidase [Myxococcota bacterium]